MRIITTVAGLSTIGETGFDPTTARPHIGQRSWLGRPSQLRAIGLNQPLATSLKRITCQSPR